MSKIVSLDVGYGFVKATDGKSGYSFPSVVGEGHSKPTFSTRNIDKSFIDNLKIELDKKLYFVGKSAIRQSKYVYRDLSYSRETGNDFEILFFSALSLFCHGRTNEFKVVTGLPAERIHMAQDLEARVRGEKDIKVFFGKEMRDIRIYVSEVEIVPQPLGSYWSQCLNLDEKDAYPIEKVTGVIDIGFRTTDLAAIESGEYIPEKSKTFSVGLSTAYSDVSSSLAEEYGLEKEGYNLDGIIIKRKVNISGKEVDITNIVENSFKKLATNVLVEVNSQWKVSDYDNLIITGGGGQALSPYLLPHLPQAKLATDPITANCRGFLDWGNRIFQPADTNKRPEINLEQEIVG